MEYLLAIDQGTTSSRAIVYGQDGQRLGLGQYPLASSCPQPGWVEQDPLEIWDSQRRAMADAIAQAHIRPGDQILIGIANQRETVMLWQREDGRPVGPAVVWQCRRTAGLCSRLAEDADIVELIASRTGLLPDAYFSGSKLQWLLEHIPGARSLADRGRLAAGTVESWLLWNLTQGRVHATDHSNASRTMLLDIHKLDWDDQLLELFHIPRSLLPRLIANSGLLGRVAPAIPGLEALDGAIIGSAVGDQQAALFGQGCLAPGQAKITYGTGCFALVNCGSQPVRPPRGLLSSVGWTHQGRTLYAAEGSAFHAGSVLQWLQEDLGLISSGAEADRLAATVPDSAGAYLVPAFTGLAAPWWDSSARGIISGLTRAVGKAQLCRAAIEGVAWQAAGLVQALAAALPPGEALGPLGADGGMSRSDVLLQFQADILEQPVLRAPDAESTALGAALLAAQGQGWEWKPRYDQPPRLFTPAMDPARREALREGWQQALRQAMTP